MPLRPNMEPQEYLGILLRRKWQVIFSIVLVLLGAAGYLIAVPDLFKSTATILVLPPQVSENYVNPISKERIHERIPTIQRQVLSRMRLLAVMDEIGLYKDERRTSSEEKLIKRMQKRIAIDVIKGKDSFNLSFEHENPKTAMLTTAKLTAFFIDENIRGREQQASTTSEFLDTELRETKARLEEQEEKVKRYKLSYMGELPQQMQANLNAMSRMQDQLRTNADSVAKLEDRKVFLEEKISKLQKEIGTIEGQMGDPDDPSQNLMADIAVRQMKIRELTLKYTSKYPTVLQLQREVDELQKKMESMRNTGSTQKGGKEKIPGPVNSGSAIHERKELRRLQEQVANLKLDISSLKKEGIETRKSIDSIQSKVSRFPQREQEMVSLMRDYENQKKAYDELLSKKLKAGVAQKLEEDQKGETFQVLDPPNLPSQPSFPDKLKVFGIAVMAAIALGIGGMIGREMMDQTLHGPQDFKHFYGYPILASLPVIDDDGGNDIRGKIRAVTLIGVCSVLSAVAIFLMIYREHIRAVLNISGGIG